ncbi:MAG TPA: 2-phospho-L-lactate guanylyltransferase [Candidatus Limnocylindria bacterium]|nr:2-phospho-L-lactate guanylyltransferase [Candidatus Limnocylindria bacterium]
MTGPQPRVADAAKLAQAWALVPIRGLESAKTRLGEDLDAEERLELVVELLRRTLIATRDAVRIAGTIVVTRDPDAAGIATRLNAVGLVERTPGLNEAIVAARSVAMARGATAVVVLPADLPGITSDAVDELVGRAAGVDDVPDSDRRGVVALVPDRHDSGTNALFVRPPALIDPAFGERSRDRHRDAAQAAGAAYLELNGPMSLDLDTGADLLEAEAALGSLRG